MDSLQQQRLTTFHLLQAQIRQTIAMLLPQKTLYKSITLIHAPFKRDISNTTRSRTQERCSPGPKHDSVPGPRLLLYLDEWVLNLDAIRYQTRMGSNPIQVAATLGVYSPYRFTYFFFVSHFTPPNSISFMSAKGDTRFNPGLVTSLVGSTSDPDSTVCQLHSSSLSVRPRSLP